MCKHNKIKSSEKVYLSSALVVMASVIPCSSIEAKNLGAREAVNQFNQISWRIVANNKIVDAKGGSWIKHDKKYGESIRKVIGEAIGDCVSEMREFAGKTREKVITFDVNPVEYTPENWNAVILWNYLNVVKYDVINNIKRDTNKIFEEIRKNVFKHYNDHYTIDNLEGKINDAIDDIKAYAKELDLYNEMKQFTEVAEKNKGISSREPTSDTDDNMISPIMFIVYEEPGQWRKAKYKSRWDEYSFESIKCVSFNVGNPRFIPIKVFINNHFYYINNYSIEWRDFEGKFGGVTGFTTDCRWITQDAPAKSYSDKPHHIPGEVIYQMQREIEKIFED